MHLIISSQRVAARYLLKVAKAKHLKALDFTIGLIRRLSSAGMSLPGGSNEAVMKRLIEMRKLSQRGFSLNTLLENRRLISGKGERILNALEAKESNVLPSDKDLAAFVRAFPDKTKPATEAQRMRMIRIISNATGEEPGKIDNRLIKDKLFFDEAYAALLPHLKGIKSSLDSAIGGSGEGAYASRIKAPGSAFKKQGRAKMSILSFRDLVGCRIVADDVASMARIADITQKKFDIVNKKNYFLKDIGYNAINYNLERDSFVFEFQLKTVVNDMEATLSHDLIYAPEKAIVNLTSEQKSLVARVIDVSTQLSMRDWAQAFNIAMQG